MTLTCQPNLLLPSSSDWLLQWLLPSMHLNWIMPLNPWFYVDIFCINNLYVWWKYTQFSLWYHVISCDMVDFTQNRGDVPQKRYCWQLCFKLLQFFLNCFHNEVYCQCNPHYFEKITQGGSPSDFSYVSRISPIMLSKFNSELPPILKLHALIWVYSHWCWR